MEIIDENPKQETTAHETEYFDRCHRRNTRTGRMLGGIVVIGVGAVLLAHQMGVMFPHWLFTWPMLLIVIGIFSGAKHQFSRGGWFVPIIIGCVFLVDDIFPDVTIGPMIWPIIIIGIGLIMILRPHRRHPHHWQKWHSHWRQYSNSFHSTEDTIDSTSVFGGVKKNIISKDFKGGEIVCVFGGAEINLSQADINGKVVLEVVQIFGGTKLIVPSHWNVQSEIVAILGGVDDNRPTQKDMINNPEKTLVIRGTSIFGGIEIKSY